MTSMGLSTWPQWRIGGEEQDHPAAIPVWAWVVWVAAVMLAAALSPWDAGYDVAHYHIHNGWAAWNGRIDIDYAPADMHSFINPAYNLLVWWLIEAVPGPVVNAVLAIPMALILPILYSLTRTISLAMTGEASRRVCLGVAVLGFFAEGQMGIFASIRNDAWGAMVFLAALALSVRQDGGLASPKRLAAASLLLGCVFGMKLTNIGYVVAYGVFVMVLAEGWKTRLRAGAVCATLGGLGFLALAAPYAWMLWERFDNPVFPMANSLFDSPVGPDDYDAYERRKAGHFLGFLVYPFVFTMDSTIIGSGDYDDLRFLFTYLAAPALLVICARRALAGAAMPASRMVVALSCAMLTAIFLWMSSFAVLRYLLAAWIVGPLFIAMVFFAVTGQARLSASRARLAAIVAVFLLATGSGPSGRRLPWNSLTTPYVTAQIPAPERFTDAFILFIGDYPSAFLAPQFPETATFAGAVPQDYFRPALANYRPMMRRAIAGQPDRPVYAVFFAMEEDKSLRPSAILTKLQVQEGLVGDPSTCERIETSFDTGVGRWLVCPVARRTETTGDPR